MRALLNPSTVLAEVVFAGKLVPVPDGPGEEQITEGLTPRSFLIKAIFASIVLLSLDWIYWWLSISINPFLILYSMHSILVFLLSSNISHFKDSTILVTQPGVRSV